MTWLLCLAAGVALLLALGLMVVRLGTKQDPLDRLGVVEGHREIRPESVRERG